MGVPILPIDGKPGEESALFLQDVVSPPEPAPRGAITTGNERFVSTASLKQRRYWASGRQIAGDGAGGASSRIPSSANQSGESPATISGRRFSAPWLDRSGTACQDGPEAKAGAMSGRDISASPAVEPGPCDVLVGRAQGAVFAQATRRMPSAPFMRGRGQ
jgi:hypothetical protein